MAYVQDHLIFPVWVKHTSFPPALTTPAVSWKIPILPAEQKELWIMNYFLETGSVFEAVHDNIIIIFFGLSSWIKNEIIIVELFW